MLFLHFHFSHFTSTRTKYTSLTKNHTRKTFSLIFIFRTYFTVVICFGSKNGITIKLSQVIKTLNFVCSHMLPSTDIFSQLLCFFCYSERVCISVWNKCKFLQVHLIGKDEVPTIRENRKKKPRSEPTLISQVL